ncbi:Na(+)/H(+) antiporter NhaA [Planctomycetota bacterium]|nr:Na(+)/H(+) antiporter NhaA [Planctomycetota bacterium]
MSSHDHGAEREAVPPWFWPLHVFFRSQASGGILLLIATVAALIWANSPWAGSYHHVLATPISFGWGEWLVAMALEHWINDVVMAVFFLAVGLEIKRELLVGELASWRQAALPVIAALGGMVVPALLFAVANAGTPTLRGWAIPTATDIAFAIGILSLLGSRVPLGLKVFLTALAIADDLGAVVVIAVFYAGHIDAAWLAAAVAMTLVAWAAGRAGIRHPVAWAGMGILLWVCVHASGVHATIAGVALAAVIPAGSAATRRQAELLRDGLQQNRPDLLTVPVIRQLEHECRSALSPLDRFEHALRPWVAFVIMPVFALANAGVTVDATTGSAVLSTVTVGIVAGLVLGKPIGVCLGTYAAIRWCGSSLPSGATWSSVAAVSLFAGIGFTMSLFVSGLAFADQPEAIAQAKLGILIGSAIAGTAGILVFLLSNRGSSS